MSEIRNLTRNGETFYPLTCTDAVVDRDGNPLEIVNDIFDISEYNASGTPPTLAKYSTLALALAAVPQSKQKGGMTIRYVQTSDNKYVQYRLMAQTFSTTESDWQRSNEEIVYNETVSVSSPTLSLQTQLVQGLAIKAGVTLKIKCTTQQSWNRLLLGFNGVNANRIKDNIVNGEEIYFVTPEPITSFWYYVTSSASSFAFFVEFDTISNMDLLEVIDNLKNKQNTINSTNLQLDVTKSVNNITITTEDAGKFLLPDGTKSSNSNWTIKRVTTTVNKTVAMLESVSIPPMGFLVCSFYNSSNEKIDNFVFYPVASAITVNCRIYIPDTCSYMLVNTRNNVLPLKCYLASNYSNIMPFETFPWYLFNKCRMQTTNLLSKFNMVEDYVIDILSGSLSFSVNNLYYTAIVLLKPNTQYIANFKIRAIVYFDAYDVFLDKVTTDIDANTVFTTPANTAKMYMLIKKETFVDNPMLVEGSSIPEYCEPDIIPAAYTDVLAHKKWVAAGDSFTHGDFNGLSSGYTFTSGLYTGENKVYPFYIGRRNPTMTVINTGVNGLTLQTYVSDEMYLDIPVDCDIYTIKIGINDSHQSIPIGTLSDSTTDTFCGCWNILIEWLTANRPNMKIGLIASNGCDTVEYSYATANIAKKYGILCLNEEKGDDVPFFYRQTWKDTTQGRRTALTNLYRVTSTNGHPNAKCHEFESTLIENFLRRL